MSDEEDFDEFPSITVNSSINESSRFSMPSAEELASQRAREDECERALLRLREEHHAADRECTDAAVAALAHSDSSGSEGEAALAAAAGALSVRPAPAAAPLQAPLQALLQALLPQPPADRLVACYLQTLRDGTADTVRAVTDEIAGIVSEMVLEAAQSEDAPAWSADEAVGVGAWLCGAVACGGAPRGLRAPLRALHLLVDEVATEEQLARLRALLTSSALRAEAALELSDALRSGGARAERLAGAVAERALAALAGPAWRRLGPRERYAALQLLARAGPVDDALLESLAQPAPGQRAHATDELKVLVAATKLRVLFRTKK